MLDYEIIKQREKYGDKDTYITVIDDNTVIPWKTLSLEDYLYYQGELPYPPAVIENEIFTKCVLDRSWVRQIDYLPAGIISTVSANILAKSGPDSPEYVDNLLNAKRNKVYNSNTNIIYDFIKLITVAFDYKPEDLYKKSFDEFMEILVLAEAKLIFIGFLENPITIEGIQKPPEQEIPRPRVDAKELWEKQQKQRHSAPNQQDSQRLKDAYDPNKGISPIFAFRDSKDKIDFSKQSDYVPKDNWEKKEFTEQRRKMVEDAQIIYKDVLDKLKKERKS